jgi:hypothetical protein
MELGAATKESSHGLIFEAGVLKLKSGRGLPQSKTLREAICGESARMAGYEEPANLASNWRADRRNGLNGLHGIITRFSFMTISVDKVRGLWFINRNLYEKDMVWR